MLIMRKTGIAGVVAAGLALGITELIAGLADQVPSVVAAVGGWVVDVSPPFVKDFAISTFGAADKGALAIGTVVVSLVLGWFSGKAAAKRFWVAVVVLGAFGIVGGVAGSGEPLASVPAVWATMVLAVGLGLAVLRLLLHLAADQDPTEAMASDPGRRRFLGATVATGVLAAVAGVVGRRLLVSVPSVPEVDLGTAAPGGGLPRGAAFDVPGVTPVVVPTEDFYRIDTALTIPRIDRDDWTLRIHGMVDREVTLGYQDLLALPPAEEHVTIACVSNEVGGHLVGNALWTGPRLVEVLEMAGVQSGAEQVVGRSIDDWTAGFPIETALDGREPIIALLMNGEALPRRHGFPARLIVPGLYGYVSATKWLTEIELTTWDAFDGYWVPRGWSKEAPIKTQSRIDVPGNGREVAAGEVVVAGVAWSPDHGISGVEVQVDGEVWTPAEISEPLSSRAWVQFRAAVQVPAGSHSIAVRATDGRGITQTAERSSPRPDGATGHHTITVRAA
jgi:DMSO/TMAO reductase YedYZ molybdopterin-dependent catalytic subunit